MPRVMIRGVAGMSFSRLAQSASGAIFCDVISRSPAQSGRRPTTAGNQRWAGAPPSLIMRPISIIVDVKCMVGLDVRARADVIGPIRNRIEPVTWATK